jgi:hypothetical protein
MNYTNKPFVEGMACLKEIKKKGLISTPFVADYENTPEY